METDSLFDETARKFRIIEEVRKRRAIWDYKHERKSTHNSAALWNEIGQVLDTDVITCKNIWSRVRTHFRTERAQVLKRIAKAKTAGSYDPNKNYSNWPFFDALRFLEDGASLKTKADPKICENNNADQISCHAFDSNSLQAETNTNVPEMMKSNNLVETTVEKLRLIEEVRKRPGLWDYRHTSQHNRKERKKLWNEIGQVLNTEVSECRRIWDLLHVEFWDEAARIEKRIAHAKKTRSYNPNEKYYTWSYFDHLRFIIDGLKTKLDIETVTNDNMDQMEPALVDSSSLIMESEVKVKLIEEVRKRPALWDITQQQEIGHKKYAKLWNEIAQILDVNVNTCMEIWANLRTQCGNEGFYHIPERIAAATEAGSYEPNQEHHNMEISDLSKEFLIQTLVESPTCSRASRELVDSNLLQTESDNDIEMLDSEHLDQTSVNTLRLIEEVQKRPALWNSRLGVTGNKRRPVWSEVGQILGANANTCMRIWKNLLAKFGNEMFRQIPRRIAKAKEEGSYDPDKDYHSWPYFNHLRFMEIGSQRNQTEPHSVDSSSLINENHSDFATNNFKLIEEVRKRPALWDCKIGVVPDKRNKLWNEIAQILDVEVNACQQFWQDLCEKYRHEILFSIPNSIAKAKEAGSYDPQKKYYDWIYFDALSFMENQYVSTEKVDPKEVQKNNSDQTRSDWLGSSSGQTESADGIEMSTAIDKTRLRKKVQKRPALCNFRPKAVQKNKSDQAKLDCHGGSSEQTESADDIEMSTEIAKMRLIKEVQKRPALWDFGPKGPGDLKLQSELWSEVGRTLGVNVNVCRLIWNSLRDQFRTEMVLCIPRRIAQAKAEGSYKPNKQYYHWVFFDALRFLANVVSPRAKIDQSITATNSGRECEDGNEFIAYDNFDNDFLSSESDCETNSNALSIDAVVKEEPELQIETENYFVENDKVFENFTSKVENEFNELEEFSNFVQNEHHNPLTSPDLNDEDYVFLCSFSSRTKDLTSLQKQEFRVNMHKLLADTFPACSSANILEKQLLLPEDHDPDRKFLISFWPFMKSMSLMQNLQFRIKIPDVLLNILSPETSQQF